MVNEKVMSYEEMSVGSTAFFKCEACPYMALAEDDMKFHLFTAHPELGLADNVRIPCPGCSAVFGAELPLRTHLRAHHKMGIKDVKKMVRSLVQLALKHVKLKKEDVGEQGAPPPAPALEPDVKMPQVIEIAPDAGGAGAGLPRGVAFISLDELNTMSAPNFEKVDPKDIIQEASINIVYTEQASARYLGVPEAGPAARYLGAPEAGPAARYIGAPEAGPAAAAHSVLHVSSVPPDLISSIHPRAVSAGAGCPGPSAAEAGPQPPKPEEPSQEPSLPPHEAAAREKSKSGAACLINGCHISLKEEKNLAYHRRCHQGGRLVCVECGKALPSAEALHTHLWKLHAVDLELPTCPVCGYKTYRRYRLTAIHMKCHGTLKPHICPVCSKGFKTSNQLSKHKLVHTGRAACALCRREFSSARRLRAHAAAVHHKLRPFQCGHCPYAAARKDELKLHLRAHSGDKPYACERCPHRAADHNAMRRHRRTHAKERAYRCDLCAYSAARPGALAAHLLAAHPAAGAARVHACPHCAFRALGRDDLARHLAAHADLAPPDGARSAWAIAGAAPAAEVYDCGLAGSLAPPPAPAGAPAQPDLHGYLEPGAAAEPAHLPPAGEPAPALPAADMLANFPIRLPPAQASHILLTPADTLPVRQVSGPGGAGAPCAAEGAPRKKPKISVKSNLILKGPDQESMFRRMDGQFGLGAPVTFNNLISTQLLQLAPGALFEPGIKLEAGKAADVKRELTQEYYAPAAEPALDFLLDAGAERYSPLPLLPDADVIEIDDNSDERKLPRFDNFPLESLYLMHSDFPFLESELPPEPAPEPAPPPAPPALQGRRDPMMNTCVRASNKINVKNIELMKN